MVKCLPTMPETRVRSLGQEDSPGEGNGTPLQYSCLENPIDRPAWQATIHGVARSWTRLSDFTSLQALQLSTSALINVVLKNKQTREFLKAEEIFFLILQRKNLWLREVKGLSKDQPASSRAARANLFKLALSSFPLNSYK